LPPPLVAVVVPAHNASRYLAETLRSVQLQTMRDFELLVVDDGSTDETRAIAEQFASVDPRISVVTQENSGVAAARNRGWRSTTAPFVAPLDSDDLWHPRKLELQLSRFSTLDERVGLVYAWTQRIDGNGNILPGDIIANAAEGNVVEELVQANIVGHASGALIRRKCLEEVGGFDETLRAAGAQGCEDLALYLAIAERHHFAVVREFLIAYRRVVGTMSHNVWEMKRSHDSVLSTFRKKHPELDVALFRRARVEVNAWLVTRTRDVWSDHLPLLWDTVRANPLFLVQPWFLGKVYRVLRRAVRWSLLRYVPPRERHGPRFADSVLAEGPGAQPISAPAAPELARPAPAGVNSSANQDL